MNNLDSLDFYVVYYPRSAGKYFVYNYEHMTNTTGIHIHDLNYLSKPNAFSIIRNPIDSITSTVIAGLIREVIQDDRLIYSINHHVETYIEMYRSIIDSNIDLYKFEDVSDNFVLVAKEVASRFNHTIANEFKDIKTDTRDRYVPTSKLDLRYPDIKSIVSNHKLIDKCNAIYNEALSSSISL